MAKDDPLLRSAREGRGLTQDDVALLRLIRRFHFLRWRVSQTRPDAEVKNQEQEKLPHDPQSG